MFWISAFSTSHQDFATSSSTHSQALSILPAICWLRLLFLPLSAQSS
jgi:hypothetical protein